MLKEALYTIIVAIVVLYVNVFWESLETFINAYKKGEPVEIDTVFGPLIGQTGVTRTGKEIYKFTSIPYGKPALGELRFEPPVKFGKWDGVLDARKKSPICTQVEFLRKTMLGQEDCLYLNVFTPVLSKFRDKKLPVMVFIYGGHFMFGSSEFYTPDYLLDENIILVTFNYRTNILGFLGTGDATVTGNQGLKDQSLVLHWIQDAISAFGGDPNRVTIFGNSAGGASVTYHMISNMSKGLFHYAISQSGTNLCAWAMRKNQKDQAIRFGNMVGCPTQNSKDLVTCLKSKPVEELMKIHFEILDIFHEENAVFAPTIEYVDETSDLTKIFLSESPTKLMQEGKFHRVPWMNGVVKDEGCFRSAILTSDAEKMQEFNTNFRTLMANLNVLPNDPLVLDKIREEYFPQKNGPLTRKDLQNITNVISDRWFFSCAKESAIYHSKYAPVYLYFFNEKPDLGYGYILEASRSSSLPTRVNLMMAYLKFLLYHHLLGWKVDDYGISHTDELQQLFMLTPELNIPYNSYKFTFSQQMTKLWASFAKRGKPDPFYGVEWKNYAGGEKLMYLKLESNKPEMIQEPFTSRVQFWKSLNLPQN
ncbi:venom carboxylesterase-6 [Folsomia candida]|uniref:venom carboxylesterase-6 n=1 Tax=Folsomia candida TaxID=158441 RepID=UPI000B8F5B2E|nr:venom carboxylesterase-6 [Folsomia candida]